MVVHHQSAPTPTSVSETLKSIRQTIYTKEQQYVPEKVKAKTKSGFLSYTDEDNWKRTLDRRKFHKSCGFFARIDNPYKECGNVELSSKTLVLDSLKEIGNCFTDEKTVVKKTKQQKSASGTDGNLGEKEVRTEEKTCIVPCLNEDGGMARVKAMLDSSNKRIISIKAGQSLNACLNKENKEKQNALDSQEQNSNNLDMVLLNPLESSLSALASKQSGEDICVDRALGIRKQKDFTDRLQCLETIFNTIQNMKLKDLRSKTALSIETLKQLRRVPTFENTTPITTTTAQRTARTSMVLQQGEVRKLQSDTSRLPLPVLHETSSKFSDVNTPMRPKNKNARQRNSPLRLETWEEFIDVQPNGEEKGASRVSLHVKNYHQPKRKNATAPGFKGPDVPWARITQEQKDEKDSKSLIEQGKERKRSDDVVNRLKGGFEEVKKIISDKIVDELEHRTDAYAKHIEYLEFNEIREKNVQKMRTKVNEWKQKMNAKLGKTPFWLESLREEQALLKLQNYEDTSAKINRLSKHSDWKRPQYAEAKLCLLVHSLPAYELCALSMKEALQWYATSYLELPAQRLNEWVKTRRLSDQNT